MNQFREEQIVIRTEIQKRLRILETYMQKDPLPLERIELIKCEIKEEMKQEFLLVPPSTEKIEEITMKPEMKMERAASLVSASGVETTEMINSLKAQVVALNQKFKNKIE